MLTTFRPPRRAGSLHLLADIGLIAGLCLALAVVFGIDLVSPKPVKTDDGSELKTVEAPPEPEPQEVPKKLRIGVTPESAAMDDMGRLLDTLGEGYQYRRFPMEDLTDPEKLAQFDVIFFTCAGFPNSWVAEQLGASDRPGMQFASVDPAIQNRLNKCLHDFVANGGTLYASDLQCSFVKQAFPEFVDYSKASYGQAMEALTADVVNPGLKDVLQSDHLTLKFDMPSWCPAAFMGQDVTVCLQGTYNTMDGGQDTAPLLVKFPVDQGTVIFTSFHNSTQNNEEELRLLRYLVFSAVTADVERRVAKTMLEGGFKKAKQNLFSASEDEPSVTQTYRNEKAGHLQFALGFKNLGARLKLTVVGPDKKTHEKEGTSTFNIDVPDAAAGDWKYTVTALKLPNENFAYNLTIGQK